MQHIFQIFLLTSHGGVPYLMRLWNIFIKDKFGPLPYQFTRIISVLLAPITMQYAEYYFLKHLLYSSRFLRDWHREGWWVGGGRGTMRLIKDNAKCRHPKQLPCGRYLSVWGPEPHPPSPHTEYLYPVYLSAQGRGRGGESWTREKGRGQQFTKLGRKYQHDLPQSPFTGQFFRWRHLALVSI